MINFGKFQENVITFYSENRQKIPFSIVFLLKTAILHVGDYLRDKHLMPI